MKGIDLEIENGEFVALMGPSGSGKSTLLNIIGCLDRPTSARFLLLGNDISRTPNEELARIRREEMGFIFQNISGGERQRVAIARALANDPQIIIADEPTGNLDLKNSDEVMKILNQLHEEGRTIIMVTHNPEITENCSRVIRLRDGRILENC